MSEEQIVKRIAVDALTGATTQSLEAGVDPGTVLATMAASAIATLRSFGVSKAGIDELVEAAEKASGTLDLANMPPAGSA